MIEIDEFKKARLEELRKLKGFFEHCLNENIKEDQVAGSFGFLSSFFGNNIEYNSFDIPLKAMKIIFEHNKEWIEKELFENEKNELWKMKT